jgi:dienelactone hydrolase
MELDRVVSAIRSNYKKCFIIGYSVGATAAWLYSQKRNAVNGIVGFYGSRIRDYMYINPDCSGLLFFPHIEKSFDVSSLVNVLSERENIQVHTYKAQHGFADSLSPNYCLEASEDAFNRMINFINAAVLP